jgi:5-methylcytosine-specific restriction endonuclease McrA
MATSRAISEAVLAAIGIDTKSYEDFVAWALCEHLVVMLAAHPEFTASFFARADSMRMFRDTLHDRTSRKWSQSDYESLYARVKLQTQTHDRHPVKYEEFIKLLWQVPLQCAFCARKPPEVVLHIDHIVPVSLGGKSLRVNLQFLCAEHNLRKSNKREEGKPWLSLR